MNCLLPLISFDQRLPTAIYIKSKQAKTKSKENCFIQEKIILT